MAKSQDINLTRLGPGLDSVALMDVIHWAGARTLIGGVYIHIFGLCPTNFF